MKELERKKVVEALKIHLNLLEIFVKDEDWYKKNYYLQLAMQLRVLLCDSDFPILIKYAKEVGKQLSISDFTPEIESDESKRPILAINFTESGWDSLQTNETIDIEEFLNKKIGTVPIKINNKEIGGAYSPTQLIKWIANKEGMAHLDLNEPQTLSSLKSIKYNSDTVVIENFVVQKKIYEIAKWCQIAIHYVLENESLNEFKTRNLEKLKSYERIEIEDLNRIAHYVPYQQNNSYFEGEHGFSIRDKKIILDNGFSLNGVIKIINQLYAGERVIFQAIDSSHNEFLKLSIDQKFNIILYCQNDQYILCNVDELEIKEKYFNFSIEIDLVDSKIHFYYDNINQSSFLGRSDLSNKTIIKDYSIGNSTLHTDAATFFMKEIIVLNQLLSNIERGGLLKYYCDTVY